MFTEEVAGEDLVAEAEALLSESGEAPEEKPETIEEPARLATLTTDEWLDDDELDEIEKERKKKEARQKKRRLVFDERLGEVVAERRRKQSRRSDDWLDFDEDD